MHLRPIAILCLSITLAACGAKGGGTLESFKERWYGAVNQRKPEQLYGLLDAKSRRALDMDLETLRGLQQADQAAVINYLGGDRVANLHEISSDRYFALWWRKATDDQLPTMTIEAVGDRSAYMVVSLKDKSQRYELKVEGGKWVWVLNEQNLRTKLPAQAAKGAATE